MNTQPLRVRRLQSALDSVATEKTRTFWERYLKGEARFRGVPMAGIRKVAGAWWMDEGLASLPPNVQKEVALGLFQEEFTEDRLAGVLILSEMLLPHLSKEDLPSFARLFVDGRISDWNLCDWFSVKVLGRMLTQAGDATELARAIAGWRSAEPLWQRRAACVAFVDHAKHGDTRIPGLPEIVLEAADDLVRDPARFAQTGAGWVLRELSLAEPDRVISFTEGHITRLSREGMRYTVEKLAPGEQRRLLDLHTRGRRPRGGQLRNPAG